MANPSIGTLTSLAEVERWIEANVPVPAPGGPAVGIGAVLAADLKVTRQTPPVPIAAIDGFAVAAEETYGASSYSPTPLTQAIALDQGTALPAGTDAVLPARAVVEAAGGSEAIETVAVGENVRAAGSDGQVGELVRTAGGPTAVTASIAADALGFEDSFAPFPLLLLASTRLRANGLWPREVFGSFGCHTMGHDAHTPALLAEGLRDPKGADAVILLGCTGEGSKDFAIATLAELGSVAFHGLALDPGETGAIGLLAHRPVLCLPGRPEASLAVALTLGRVLVRRLKGAGPMPQPTMRGRLTRKIVANPGRTRLIYADVRGDQVEPLGSSNLPLAAFARAIGYLLLPPGSEGLPAGALVDVMPLPGYLAL